MQRYARLEVDTAILTFGLTTEKCDLSAVAVRSVNHWLMRPTADCQTSWNADASNHWLVHPSP